MRHQAAQGKSCQKTQANQLPARGSELSKAHRNCLRERFSSAIRVRGDSATSTGRPVSSPGRRSGSRGRAPRAESISGSRAFFLCSERHVRGRLNLSFGHNQSAKLLPVLKRGDLRARFSAVRTHSRNLNITSTPIEKSFSNRRVGATAASGKRFSGQHVSRSRATIFAIQQPEYGFITLSFREHERNRTPGFCLPTMQHPDGRWMGSPCRG